MGFRRKRGERELLVKEITMVSAVDAGDNPDADIVLFKSHGSAESAEQTQGDGMSDDITAISDEPTVEDLQKSLDEAAAKIEALEATVTELTPVEDPIEVDVEKASDEVQALIAKQRDQLDEQATRLEVEVTKRRDTEFISKVREDNLEVLLGLPEKVGPVLRELDDLAPEAFGKIYKPLLAAAQRAELASVLKELGANDGSIDPQAQKAAWVSKQKQDGSDKTDAELANAFWAAHPDAVKAERENK